MTGPRLLRQTILTAPNCQRSAERQRKMGSTLHPETTMGGDVLPIMIPALSRRCLKPWEAPGLPPNDRFNASLLSCCCYRNTDQGYSYRKCVSETLRCVGGSGEIGGWAHGGCAVWRLRKPGDGPRHRVVLGLAWPARLYFLGTYSKVRNKKGARPVDSF